MKKLLFILLLLPVFGLSQPMQALLSKRASTGPSTATFSPSLKGTFIVLGGGNLNATLSAFTGQVLSSVAIPAGTKVQAEFTVNTAGNCVVGIDLSTANLEDAAGNDATGYGVYMPTGDIYKNGGSLAGGTPIANGSVVTVAVDDGAHTIQVKVNGVLQYSGAVTITSGTWHFTGGFLSSTGSITVNFTVATMTYAFAGYGQLYFICIFVLAGKRKKRINYKSKSMKKILTLILIMVCFKSFGQTPFIIQGKDTLYAVTDTWVHCPIVILPGDKPMNILAPRPNIILPGQYLNFLIPCAMITKRVDTSQIIKCKQ